MKPFDIHAIAVSMIGRTLNGELVHVSERVQPFVEQLAKLPEGERSAALDAYSYAMENRSEFLRLVADADPYNPPDHTSEAAKPRSALASYTLASVKPMPTRWLARMRIPLGKLILLAGIGGLGKSFLALYIAAMMTIGRFIFEEGDNADLDGPCDVLLIAAEDDAADTQLPRFLALGGNPDRVHVVQGIRGVNGKIRPFDLNQVEELRQRLVENPAIKLIIIDPIAAYAGRAKIDDHKNSELSAILAPLVEIAAEADCTILMVAHLNKGVGNKAVTRIMGGSAYVNSTRCSFVVAEDPDDPTRRVLDAVKFNLAERPKPIAFDITGLEPDEITTTLDHPAFKDMPERDLNLIARQLAKVRLLGDSEKGADECLSSQPRSTRGQKRADAKEWLLQTLMEAEGGSLDSSSLKAKAALLGYSWDMLGDAKKELPQVRVRKQGKESWYWYVDAGYLAEAKKQGTRD